MFVSLFSLCYNHSIQLFSLYIVHIHTYIQLNILIHLIYVTHIFDTYEQFIMLMLTRISKFYQSFVHPKDGTIPTPPPADFFSTDKEILVLINHVKQIVNKSQIIANIPEEEVQRSPFGKPFI